MQEPQVAVRAEADGVRVVVCSGEFDLDTTGLLVDACDVRPMPADLLVVDVRQVTFGDSSFLNALIRLRNTRRLALLGPLPNQLHRMMQMTGALPLFEICDTIEHAG
ncbi:MULTISPECIES: STAS domain-containing protein [Streptomyces]|uniref:STAS domain-containing protein n=1 Tax=Streptomyces yangpuensis TaxID=1648182 RepID=A0ABY5Q4V6_9ACTN|nr:MULTISPECIES: STAS domain-containing protein [Streptomyces]MBZ9599913.1 STAS domain-containing protein [Streptomyces erythrochromogenes]UUY51471.1 STAS domain-containing protein [Streptomyces yangpuensis]